VWQARQAQLKTRFIGCLPRWDELVQNRGTEMWLALQTLVVLLLVAYMTLLAHRTRWEMDDRARVIYALGYWIVPLSLGPAVSLYRQDALLCVAGPILRHAPRRLQSALLLALVLLDYKIAIRYFTGAIV
jgi:hypothetical protein